MGYQTVKSDLLYREYFRRYTQKKIEQNIDDVIVTSFDVISKNVLDPLSSSHHPLHGTWCQISDITNSLGDTVRLQRFTESATFATVRHIRQPNLFQSNFKRLGYLSVEVPIS